MSFSIVPFLLLNIYHAYNYRKSYLILYFIINNYKDFPNPDVLKTLVQAKLKYNAVIWLPLYYKYLNTVQNRFLRFIASFECNISRDSCTTFSLLAIIKNILHKSNLSYGRKNINGYTYIDCPELLSFLNFNVSRCITRSIYIFDVFLSITKCINIASHDPLKFTSEICLIVKYYAKLIFS